MARGRIQVSLFAIAGLLPSTCLIMKPCMLCKQNLFHAFLAIEYACPLWMMHVHACARRWLSLEDAQARVLTELRHYAKAAWSFLHAAGYINFGVAPAIAKRALGAPQERGCVIIVGAGLAGARS